MEKLNEEIFVIGIDYDDFKKIPSKIRNQIHNGEGFELQINISPKKFALLTASEKAELSGFTIVNTLKKEKEIATAKSFALKPLRTLAEKNIIKETYKEKHRAQLKPYIPLKIGIVNPKKRGGR